MNTDFMIELVFPNNRLIGLKYHTDDVGHQTRTSIENALLLMLVGTGAG